MEHNSDSSHSGLDYADIGCRVREARVEYGLTQEELAEDVGVDAKHISRIENGHKKGSDQLIRRIGEVTGKPAFRIDCCVCAVNMELKAVLDGRELTAAQYYRYGEAA